MTEIKMLVINHIEPVGLIAKEALYFMGSVAGHALAHMFDNLDIKQIDSVLAQLRSYVIQSKGS